jgi:hypothetical protein
MSHSDELTVVFGGDVAFSGPYEKMAVGTKNNIFGDATNIFKTADFSIINLECPLTNSTKSVRKAGPNLKAHPETAEALRHISMCSLANNHILDFGTKGLADTLTTLTDRRISYFGAGLTEFDVRQPLTVNMKGVKIGFHAICELEFNYDVDQLAGASLIDPIENTYDISKLRNECDILFLIIHGGIEGYNLPSPKFRKLCHYFVSLGVDAIICHHSHVVGATENMAGVPIFYSLGNLILKTDSTNEKEETGILVKFKISAKQKKITGYDIVPFFQSPLLGGVSLMSEDEDARYQSQLEAHSAKLLTNDWLKEWNVLVQKKAPIYLSQLYFPFYIRGLKYIWAKYLSKVLNKSPNTLRKQNFIVTDSHHEILADCIKEFSAVKYD